MPRVISACEKVVCSSGDSSGGAAEVSTVVPPLLK
jgi:hypothetical protein